MCGTPEYIAPEILSGDMYTKMCDWWSYGALLYDLVTGSPPFYQKDKRELMKLIKTMDVPLPKNVSEECRDLLRNLLKRDPNERLG